MNGRRKVHSYKRSLQTRFEIEAKWKLGNISKKAAHRFLDVALVFGADFEPTGLLSGGPRSLELGEDFITTTDARAAAKQETKTNLTALLPQALEIVVSAGQLLITEWQRLDGPRGQDDKAAVDVEIEYSLRQQLLELFPCDFWGEETGHRLTGNPWCWVVDPNDGTNDFLKGLKGSALSVALLYEQIPVLGVVYAPITVEGVPDCIAWAEGLPKVLRNGQPVTTELHAKVLSTDTYVMVSSAAVDKPQINDELCKPGRFIAMPSIAYRLAKVAAGDGVCGVSLYPVAAHDVAAGHALLRGAGGVLLDERGDDITYVTEANMQKASLRCFGGSVSACQTLVTRDWNRIFIEKG